MPKDKDLNHIAYNDVLCSKSPTIPENIEYMQYYRYWAGISGPSQFDPYY